MEQINERMKRIDNIQKDRYLLEEERKKVEDEIINKKKIMLKRLQNVINSNKKMTKNEIMDYVFDYKQGNRTTSDEVKINYNDKKRSKSVSPVKEN